VPILEDDDPNTYSNQYIAPIIAEGDVLGAVVFLSSDKKMGEVESKLAVSAANFLGRQMEQ
jgi:AbrB family transcriptional regulator (stage V sporulation protein T)